MSGLGHNNGPSMEPGYSWRKHSWVKARKALLPTLPIEVLRGRVKRAKALGLPYKTYASVRAASGHDVVGFLFSNNALRVIHEGQAVPQDRVTQLQNAEAAFTALVHRPLAPDQLVAQLESYGIELIAERAPHFAQTWSTISDDVRRPLLRAGLPRDGVLVIGDTAHERDWSVAAKLAGFLSSERYFAVAT